MDRKTALLVLNELRYQIELMRPFITHGVADTKYDLGYDDACEEIQQFIDKFETQINKTDEISGS